MWRKFYWLRPDQSHCYALGVWMLFQTAHALQSFFKVHCMCPGVLTLAPTRSKITAKDDPQGCNNTTWLGSVIRANVGTFKRRVILVADNWPEEDANLILWRDNGAPLARWPQGIFLSSTIRENAPASRCQQEEWKSDTSGALQT